MKYKANKDNKVRIILTARYNSSTMMEHPLGAGAQRQYNKYMKQPLELINKQYATALNIINNRLRGNL